MYTQRQQPSTPYDGLGLLPAFVVGSIPAVADWLGGHSSLYNATVQAIPVYGTQALAGDVCAYMVLKSWSGDQTFCRYAIDHCHDYYLGTKIGQAGPCGAADSSTKAAAKAQADAVDSKRPDVANAARTVLAGGPMPTAPASGSSGGGRYSRIRPSRAPRRRSLATRFPP